MIFGVIGLGRFGKLLASKLQSLGTVKGYDVAPGALCADINCVPLSEVIKCDILFLLVPISAFAACCLRIASLLSPETIVVDCCSVKVYPVDVMQKTLPHKQPYVPTHPLFGPDSVAKIGDFAGHKVVVCPVAPRETQLLTELLAHMGLQVQHTSPKIHDRQMATSQALVHFIGRGLASLDLKDQDLATPDFTALRNMQKMVNNDRLQLFKDMQRYNPYAKAVREKLLTQLIAWNDRLEKVRKS